MQIAHNMQVTKLFYMFVGLCNLHKIAMINNTYNPQNYMSYHVINILNRTIILGQNKDDVLLKNHRFDENLSRR